MADVVIASKSQINLAGTGIDKIGGAISSITPWGPLDQLSAYLPDGVNGYKDALAEVASMLAKEIPGVMGPAITTFGVGLKDFTIATDHLEHAGRTAFGG